MWFWNILSGGREVGQIKGSGGTQVHFFLSHSISGRSILQALINTSHCGSGLLFSSFLSQVQPLSTSHPIATAQALGCPSNGGSKNLIHGSLRCRKMILNISFLGWWELEAPGEDLAESFKWALPGIHWVTVLLAVMIATPAFTSQWEGKQH